LEAIGNTPAVKLRKVVTREMADVVVKLSAQACAYLLARDASALAIPFHGVIGSYTSRYAHAENLLQTMGT
jgi:hypothetical protein